MRQFVTIDDVRYFLGGKLRKRACKATELREHPLGISVMYHGETIVRFDAQTGNVTYCLPPTHGPTGAVLRRWANFGPLAGHSDRVCVDTSNGDVVRLYTPDSVWSLAWPVASYGALPLGLPDVRPCFTLTPSGEVARHNDSTPAVCGIEGYGLGTYTGEAIHDHFRFAWDRTGPTDPATDMISGMHEDGNGGVDYGALFARDLTWTRDALVRFALADTLGLANATSPEWGPDMPLRVRRASAATALLRAREDPGYAASIFEAWRKRRFAHIAMAAVTAWAAQ